MSNKRYTSDEISSKLQQIKLFMLTGDRLPEACMHAGISKQSYYRWKKQLAAANNAVQKNSREEMCLTNICHTHDMSLIRNSMFSYK